MTEKAHASSKQVATIFAVCSCSGEEALYKMNPYRAKLPDRIQSDRR